MLFAAAKSSEEGGFFPIGVTARSAERDIALEIGDF
jgi:hypothetical protein